jgi:ferric enterobactin receptor
MKHRYLKFSLLLCALSFLMADLSAQGNRPQFFTIYGTISDSISGEPLDGAAVFIPEKKIGAYTDKKGFYAISIPPGDFTMRISLLGYTAKNLPLKVDQNKILDAAITKDQKFLEEVTVTSNRPEENIKSTESGVSKLSIRSIRKIPAFMGEIDVVRSLQMLPGVSSVGEGTTGINVRGGSIDQNLVLMDDAPVYNSSHLFGFFSVFNPDAVRDVTLYRGGISAQFAGRTSAVLDVKLKDPDLDKRSIYGGIGLVSNRFGIEMPLIKNKLAISLAGRGSFNDFLFKLGPRSIENTVANFYDLTGKVLYKPSEKTRLSYTGYYSYDVFKLPSDSLSSVDVNASSSTFKYRTFNQTLRFNWFLKDKTSLTFTAVQSRYMSNTAAQDSSIAFDMDSGIRLRSLKGRYFSETDNNSFSFGAEANSYVLTPNQLVPGPFSNLQPIAIQEEFARELGVFIEDEWKLSKRFSILAGLRYSYFQRLGPDTIYAYPENVIRRDENVSETTIIEKGESSQNYGGLEPRLSLKYELNDNTSLKMSYNRMRQYIQLISNTTAALPTARWGSSDRNINPQVADQLTLGFFKNIKDNKWETSAEVYYKLTEGFPDYKDLADLQFSRNLEQEVIQGQGKAYGLELMLRKNTGFLTGWLSYTFARTLIKVDERFEPIHNYAGAWYPANYDKPHTLNAMMNYRMSRTVTFSANFTYSTGRPGTFPAGKFEVNGNIVPIFPDRNLQRIPDYHRLDLALIIDPNPDRVKKIQGSWIISVYNVYSRNNAYSIFFDLNPALQTNSYKLAIFGSVFPSLTYNFKIGGR